MLLRKAVAACAKALRYDRAPPAKGEQVSAGLGLVLLPGAGSTGGSQRQQRGTGLGHMGSTSLRLGGLAGWDARAEC